MTICACGCGQEVPWKKSHSWRPPKYIPRHQHQDPNWRKEHGERVTIKPPSDFNPTGFCECGCGQKTPIAKQTELRRGHYRGYPIRYIPGHNRRGKAKSNRKGFKIDCKGYKLIYDPDHHLANKSGYVVEHRLIWEEANGRRLNSNEDVHHINGKRSDNSPENLIALTLTDHRKIHCAKNGFLGKTEAQARKIANPKYRKKLSESGIKAWIKRKAQKENEDGH
jgi:hypothetical protein